MKRLILALVFATGCTVVRQQGQPDQSIDPVNPEVRVRVVNNCAPLLRVTKPDGQVFNVRNGQSVLIILKHYAGTSVGNYAEPLLVQARSSDGRVNLGSTSRSFNVNANQYGHTEVWEINGLSNVPQGSPGCTGGREVTGGDSQEESSALFVYIYEMKVTSRSPEETRDIAERLIRPLRRGDRATVIALEGDLGAGKTAFSQFVGETLGVHDPIQSPTFLIEKIYELRRQPWVHLVHIDAYRLEDEQELLDLGWQDIIEKPENLILIEWADRVRSILPEDAIHIGIRHVDETTREITIDEGIEEEAGSS